MADPANPTPGPGATSADGAGASAAGGGAERRSFMPGFDGPMATFQEMDAQGRRTLEAMVASVTAAAQGAQELAAHAADYARQMMEHQARAAQALAAARSPQEVIEAQSAYNKAAMEAYVNELRRASQAMGDIVNASLKPLSAAADRTGQEPPR
ncbi:phasin family protein [Phenylobacterium terrae]|uniref:Phasin family protein n=1 Tax=Phenylobacterium terrae TaxID=2665495 RepID=A0ABW4N5E3_9CAUL